MSVSVGTTNKAAISAISLLDKREILKAAVDVQNEEGLTDILQLAGRMVETKQPVYSDFTEDALYQFIDTTGATVTNSGTTSVTVALTAAKSGFLVPGDSILTVAGKEGYVYSVSTSAGADTVVIKSVNAETLAIVAGDKLSPFSNIAGEGSTAPSNRKYGWTSYSNNVRIFRGTNVITDVQDASEIEIEYNGQNYVFSRDIANKFIKFKGDINAAFIAGRKGSTLFSDASPSVVDPVGGGAMQSSMGLHQYVSTYGVNGNVSSAGTVTIADFTTFLNALTAARAPKKHMAFGASAAMAPVSACFKNLNSSGVTGGRLSLDGKEVDFNIEKVSHMGYEVQFGVLPIMDHPVLLSQTSIVKNMYFIPEGKVATKLNGAQDRIRVRYMKNKIQGLGNDIYAEWDTGALARGGATSDVAIRRTNWQSTQGLQVLGAQQFGLWQVL